MIEKSSQVVIKIKPKALRILRIVAKSEKPLSSGDIEKGLLGVTRLREKRDPQVYNILSKYLCKQKFKYPCFLFDWNELVSSIEQARKTGETSTVNRVRKTVVENFNRIGWRFDEHTVEFTGNDRLIEIKTNDSCIIKVERDSKYKDHAFLKVFENGEEKRARETHLTIKTVGKKRLISDTKEKEFGNIKIQVFYEGINGNPFERGTSYLKTSLNEKSRKESEMIRNIERQSVIDHHQRHFTTDQEDSILSKIEGDRSHWDYSLNTRGLILLVLGIVGEEQEKRDRNVEVSNILRNLSENFQKDFPYLMCYDKLRKIYDEVAKEEKGYEYFQVHLMKRVALELQCVIDTLDTDELNYYVTKHYSLPLTNYYTGYASALTGYLESIPNSIKQYYLVNLEWIKKYLDEQLKETTFIIDNFSTAVGSS